MEKHLSMKQISLHMSKAYSTNTSLIQVQKCLALVIPNSWKYTVLVEAHDKLGYQGNTCTYCLIKSQYYWKAINKDVKKYIANCTLCHREKARVFRCWKFQTDHMTNLP